MASTTNKESFDYACQHPSARPFSFKAIPRRLMSGARATRSEFACEENQRCADYAGASK